MTSPLVSIYCQSIPGQELWNALKWQACIVSTIHVAERAEVGVGDESLKDGMCTSLDVDHMVLSSFRCDFDDTAQYRVSAMNSKGELSAFASVVVKSTCHQVLKPSHHWHEQTLSTLKSTLNQQNQEHGFYWSYLLMNCNRPWHLEIYVIILIIGLMGICAILFIKFITMYINRKCCLSRVQRWCGWVIASTQT